MNLTWKASSSPLVYLFHSQFSYFYHLWFVKGICPYLDLEVLDTLELQLLSQFIHPGTKYWRPAPQLSSWEVMCIGCQHYILRMIFSIM
jgi:hypothetical protein